MKWRVLFVRTAINCFAKSETVPAEFFQRFCQMELALSQKKIQILIKMQKPLAVKRSIYSHFPALSLN